MRKPNCYNKIHYNITVTGYVQMDDKAAELLAKHVNKKAAGKWVHSLPCSKSGWHELRANCIDSEKAAMNMAIAMREAGAHHVHFHKKISQSVKELL